VARTWALPEERRIREAETRNDGDVRMRGIPILGSGTGEGRADDGDKTLYLLLRGEGWGWATIGGSGSRRGSVVQRSSKMFPELFRASRKIG
jgi:hypothetical protein